MDLIIMYSDNKVVRVKPLIDINLTCPWDTNYCLKQLKRRSALFTV